MELEFHQLEIRYEHLRVRRPEREHKLLASLAATGQQVPIVVVPLKDTPDRFLVIDGHKRIRALRRLGQDTVQATAWQMTEAEALVLDRSLRASEAESALEQGWLLAELQRGFGYSMEELARRFDRSTSWVSRRLALVELLPEAIQQQVRDGEIRAHVAMKFLVPVARTSFDDCRRMADAFAAHKLNTRDAAELYAAWRDSSPGIRQRILDDPTLFLKARRQMENDQPGEKPAAADFVRDLEIILAVAKRASRRWRSVAGLMTADEVDCARHCLEKTVDDLCRLARRMEKETVDAKQESTNSDSGAISPGSKDTEDRPNLENLPVGAEESDSVGLDRCASPDSGRESPTAPAADPGALRFLPRQPGPSP